MLLAVVTTWSGALHGVMSSTAVKARISKENVVMEFTDLCVLITVAEQLEVNMESICSSFLQINTSEWNSCFSKHGCALWSINNVPITFESPFKWFKSWKFNIPNYSTVSQGYWLLQSQRTSLKDLRIIWFATKFEAISLPLFGWTREHFRTGDIQTLRNTASFEKLKKDAIYPSLILIALQTWNAIKKF